MLFNPLIRFALLNTLKFNIMAMVTFASISSKPSAISFCLAAIILLAINALPFVFARIIRKAKDDLHDADRVQKYGTLYKGLYVGD